MPEYLAPGVYVEEVSFRSKSIEGVSTTTTGFVGPTLYGPVEEEPEVLTSLLDFERTYGGGIQLRFGPTDASLTDEDDDGQDLRLTSVTNHMWQAARAFFDNGGARLYVKRIYRGIPIGPAPADTSVPDTREVHDGHADTELQGGGAGDATVRVRARFPGAAGARHVRLTLARGQNILSSVTIREGTEELQVNRARGLQDRDVVLIERVSGSPVVTTRDLALARLVPLDDGSLMWRFISPDLPIGSPPGGPNDGVGLDELVPGVDRVSIITIAVTDLPTGDNGPGRTWAGLPIDQDHERAGARDSLFARFSQDPPRRADRWELPVVVETEPAVAGDPAPDGLAVVEAILAHAAATATPANSSPTLLERLESPASTDAQRSIDLTLTGGLDGRRPVASDYDGRADPDEQYKYGLKAFEDLEDISIVAAPGSTEGYSNGYRNDADSIIQSLIGHCERMRYRIAVLDAGDQLRIGDVRAMRAKIDSKHAALYYPWVVVMDPITQRELALPPSGFVTGIYARNDRLRAVYKAPANEVVTGALRFETMLNRSQQEVLNPEGINCFRFFEGRGNRLWGARTISSDPEWKYVNLRRYFAYLERSIDVGTQWAVFEPNGEMLWANVRRTIEDFLLNEFQMGALLGDKPEKAYFVKCDRSTMTQNDLDNGRLVCLADNRLKEIDTWQSFATDRTSSSIFW
jgi:phage tail sheath protein FI